MGKAKEAVSANQKMKAAQKTMMMHTFKIMDEGMSDSACFTLL